VVADAVVEGLDVGLQVGQVSSQAAERRQDQRGERDSGSDDCPDIRSHGLSSCESTGLLVPDHPLEEASHAPEP
jgi:hypothetical protein